MKLIKQKCKITGVKILIYHWSSSKIGFCFFPLSRRQIYCERMTLIMTTFQCIVPVFDLKSICSFPSRFFRYQQWHICLHCHLFCRDVNTQKRLACEYVSLMVELYPSLHMICDVMRKLLSPQQLNFNVPYNGKNSCNLFRNQPFPMT